jgi:3-deoxy-7-phosphoheptulonate synthase
MNYAIIKKLPSSNEITQTIPLSKAGYQKIAQDRKEVQAILEGSDPRLLMIVGPCSAWPKKAVLQYAEKLFILNERIKDKIKIVMRVYIQKPRTTKGWTGPINQPDPLAYPDIEAGMRYTREMMIKVIEMGLPIADEALFTHNASGFLELLSWVAIGARSAEDQEHRIFASAIDCAVGLKNPTYGSLDVGVNSVMAAQYPHVAAFDGYEVQTNGNAHAHLVLRGSSQNGPNYSIAHLEEIKKHMEKHEIKNPAVMIDASHDNCIVDGKKDPSQQPKVVWDVIESLAERPDLKKLVKGFMIESFLKEGAQKIEGKSHLDIDMQGLSITDPCLSWERTERLLLDLSAKTVPLV